MKLDFTFFDRDHDGKYDYDWECDCTAVPRIGDEVMLPGLEGGGPLCNHEDYKEATLSASAAIVDNIAWNLESDDSDDGVEVWIYCYILWE